MKFSILSDYLKEHLDIVNRVISPKNQLSIMEYVLFRIEGKQLTLTATDGETRILTSMELESKEGDDLAFCVRAKQLLDPLKEIPDLIMEFEINMENLLLEGNYGMGNFSFPLLAGNEFPESEALTADSVKIEMPVSTFSEALDSTIYAASVEEIRPVMTGVHLDIRPEHISFVATNGFLLALYRHSALDLGVTDRTQITIQRKPADLLRSLLSRSNEEEKLSVEIFHNYAVFRTTSMELQCRLLEGKYPNYETVIPTDNDKVMEADRLQLLSATTRVKVFADKGMQLVSFDFAPKQLTLKASDSDFSTSAEETVPVSFSADAARFSFRADHVIQILRALQTQNISMKIGDSARAALVSPIGGEVGVEITVAMMPLMF